LFSALIMPVVSLVARVAILLTKPAVPEVRQSSLKTIDVESTVLPPGLTDDSHPTREVRD
jgi:hypothetical protein